MSHPSLPHTHWPRTTSGRQGPRMISGFAQLLQVSTAWKRSQELSRAEARQAPKKEHSASRPLLPRMISDSSVPIHRAQRPGSRQGRGCLSPSLVPEVGLGGDAEGQSWGASRGKCPHPGRRRCLLPTRHLASLLAALLSPPGLCPPPSPRTHLFFFFFNVERLLWECRVG